MKSYLKAIFTMIRDVLQQKQVYTNKNKKIVSSGDNAETAFRILCTPYFFQEQFSDGSKTINNYGSSLINKGKIQGQNGFRVGKAMIEMCLNGGLYSLKKHLDNIFLDSSAYNYFTSNYDLAPMYMLNKKIDIKQLDVDMFEKNRTSLMDECNQAYVNVLLVLSEVLKCEIYKNSFNYYNVDNSSVSSEKATLFLTVLIAAYIRKLETENMTVEHKKEVEQLLEQLEKEISIFVRENNLGSGKLTSDDFICFTDVSPKDNEDATAFKRISEFFIAPTLKLNNDGRVMKYLIEGNSGVGKTTLLKAINNIFVIENTDTTEFPEKEKHWYNDLKCKLFTDSGKTYLPIYIEAVNANKSADTFDLLDLANGYKKTLLINLIKSNDNVILLIDGIEEVELYNGKRKAFEDAYAKFVSDYKDKIINIIVTTRYSGVLSCVNEYKRETLKALNLDHIITYIKENKIIGDNIKKDRIITLINSSQEMKDFVCTPFMLEKLITLFSQNSDVSIYDYLKSVIDAIIRRRWDLSGSFTKILLGYIAIKIKQGQAMDCDSFNELIDRDNLPECLSTMLKDAEKEKEYCIFKEQWKSKSGILSYTNDDNGEIVSFENKLAMSYLASLFVLRWFSHVEKIIVNKETGEKLCYKSRIPNHIDYLKNLKLFEEINKTFDLTENTLRAFLFVLSNGEMRKQDFENNILLMFVFLKYASLTPGEAENEARAQTKNFFIRLKNKEVGNNIISNPSTNALRIAMKGNVDYIISDV